MHGRLLVPHQNVLHLVLLKEGVVDVQDSATGVAEDVVDAFFLQTAHDDFCAGNFHEGWSHSRSGEPARRRQRTPTGHPDTGLGHRAREIDRTPH